MPGLDPAATALARFRYATSANRVLLAGERFRRVLKANFHPTEPRIPAGNPGIGGRWTDEGGGAPRAATRSELETTTSLYETIEGEISANEGATREAQDRLFELSRVRIGPGPFAAESQPARGPGRRWTAEEIRENNRIGRTYGCHTCGTKDPGTSSGNFVLDHQNPNALRQQGEAQRLYPQCLACSHRQAGYVTSTTRK